MIDETLGMIVREVWSAAVQDIFSNPPESWKKPWSEIPDTWKEVNIRVGKALFETGRTSGYSEAMSTAKDIVTEGFKELKQEVEQRAFTEINNAYQRGLETGRKQGYEDGRKHSDLINSHKERNRGR